MRPMHPHWPLSETETVKIVQVSTMLKVAAELTTCFLVFSCYDWQVVLPVKPREWNNETNHPVLLRVVWSMANFIGITLKILKNKLAETVISFFD